MGAGPALMKRMDSYWRMERTCVFLFPPIAFAASRPDDLLSGAVLALALVACCATLWIGAEYWRAVWKSLQGDRSVMGDALALADRWQARCATLAAVAMVVSFLTLVGHDVSTAAIAALGLSLLAGLEYVNYYHIQLQNFDHGPTLRRFCRARRFPRAHLAKALGAYRLAKRR